MDDLCRYGVEFFKQNKKYHRILTEIATKYKSIGSIGGIIELKNLNSEEQSILSKIDSKFISSKDAKFSAKKFFKTFDGTKLEGADFTQILKMYFNDDLKTTKEIRENKQNDRDIYFDNILAYYENTKAYDWLNSALKNKNYGYMQIIIEYEKDNKNLKNILINVMEAINKLSKSDNNLMRLAIFASEITKNPHYFDNSQTGGKLLISALSYLSNIQYPENSEGENELLYSYGILRDEISNFTTSSNILAYANNVEHMGIKGFFDINESLQLNLYNLTKIDYIKCTQNMLFVFENPTVFSEVFEKTKDIKPSLLCTSGQLKLSSIIFFDKLIKNIDKIYYSGDFDPEGINIAYKLKKKYGSKIVFWRFDLQSYNKIKSNIKAEDRRIKQIENIDDDELVDLLEEIKISKFCGYQELLVEDYINDIKFLINPNPVI